MTQNITELRHNFKRFYDVQGQKLSSPSDAFYLYNNGHQTEFFELLQIENIQEFQPLAYELLRDTLMKKSSAKGNNIGDYIKGISLLWKYLHEDTTPYTPYKPTSIRSAGSDATKPKAETQQNNILINERTAAIISDKHIPRPSCAEADRYLQLWETNEDYYRPDEVLSELFTKVHPFNNSVDEVLLKAAALNTVYNTRITSIYPVVKHILSIKNLDDRLFAGDEYLVNELMCVSDDEDEIINYYSFASKYCSFHNPDAFPIYDSYIDGVLWYYKRAEGYSTFYRKNLKVYPTFKRILADFRRHFRLEKYTTKQLDQYLWQFGKEYF